MKDIEDIKIKDLHEFKTPEGKSPIFFVNLTAEIREGNSKKGREVYAKRIVVKGTLEQILKADQTKKQFLREFLKDVSGAKVKISKFDLSKIVITDVEIIRGLGYGVKL